MSESSSKGKKEKVIFRYFPVALPNFLAVFLLFFLFTRQSKIKKKKESSNDKKVDAKDKS